MSQRDIILQNLQNYFIIGNPVYNTTADFNEQIASNTPLSPYNKLEITVNNQKYPSIIHYLLSLRLCYKESKEQLEQAEPNEVREVFLKYEKKCERVFKKYAKSYKIKTSATEFVKEGFETVQDYLFDKTEKGLLVLYEVISTNSEMKNALMNSGDKKIIFHDPDNILGDGDGQMRGANLYGKKLEEVRKFLKSNYQRDCIATKELQQLVNLSSESKIEEFNPLEKWAYKKLEFVCKIIAKFFVYLCKPRLGYTEISIPPIIINNYTNPKTKKNGVLVLTQDNSYDDFFKGLSKKSKDKTAQDYNKIENYEYQGEKYNGWEINKENLSDVLQFINTEGKVNPKITSQMSLYCIKDIMSCGILNTFEGVNFPNPDDVAIKVITQLILKNIDNRFLANSTTVDILVVRDVFQYVFILTEYVMLQTFSKEENKEERKNNEEIYNNYINVANNNEQFVLNNKRDYFNHGFATDEENAIAQFILYSIIAITDYIDLDVIGTDEINFCIELLNLNQTSNLIPPVNRLMTNSNEFYVQNVIQMFSEKGQIVSEEMARIIANLIHTVNENMDNPVIQNRVYFFSNFI
jgi:hypothetical protein